MSVTDRSKETIFVQIASYRDVELPRTIQSALDNATHPERLRFGICWQYDEYTLTDLDEYLTDARFRISQVHFEQSLGCCWARNQTNLLYRDETYTLQIDAHTRFIEGWDVQYIEMLCAIDAEKPLLTTYPPPFNMINDVEEQREPRNIQRLVLNRMDRNLTTIFKTVDVPDGSPPEASQFLAAGQIFTQGIFCREVEYDPNMYYSGEEISLSARAYTHGYDMFCPNKHLIWHLYRHKMPTHWRDIFDHHVLQMTDCRFHVDEKLQDKPVSYMLWPKTWDDGFLPQQFFDL